MCTVITHIAILFDANSQGFNNLCSGGGGGGGGGGSNLGSGGGDNILTCIGSRSCSCSLYKKSCSYMQKILRNSIKLADFRPAHSENEI